MNYTRWFAFIKVMSKLFISKHSSAFKLFFIMYCILVNPTILRKMWIRQEQSLMSIYNKELQLLLK